MCYVFTETLQVRRIGLIGAEKRLRHPFGVPRFFLLLTAAHGGDAGSSIRRPPVRPKGREGLSLSRRSRRNPRKKIQKGKIQMKKRLLSLLLSLCMVLCLLPTAYADSENYWTNFRNSPYNMAITDAPTPTSAETTVEKWAKSFGSGWQNSPSAFVIADNSLLFMNMSSLKKVDLQTGNLLGEATMSASGGYVIISPTYADGTVFCPLSGGKIEAFDAGTLQSRWVFADELKGQNNTPITYADGYLYTGFWNGEAKDANFVCVNAADGRLVWKKTVTGGFYWAGSTVVGNAVIVGTDDGANGFVGDSHLLALDKTTGDVISDLTLTGMGDQRSSMAYSAEKGRVYFTTKNGYIASAAVDATTGALSDLKSSKVAAQSTTTPVVYGDKVFFGAGSGIVPNSNGAGNFIVADADTLEGLYAVPLLAYPQGSVMVSTAYLAQTGRLYCYTTYNGKPGGMTLITVDPADRTGANAVKSEIYDAAGHEQFCLISPICGPDGTIYYRNDSGCVFALAENKAYLSALTADTGKWDSAFAAGSMRYELVVPKGTGSVTFTAAACDGGSVSLNGGSASAPVPLTDGNATASFTVTKGADTRTYTVTIREASGDASLSLLHLNETNGYSGFKTLTPAFAPEEHFYGFYAVGSGRSFENIWPQAAHRNATVRVMAVENVDRAAEDGTVSVTATNGGHNRYAIYFRDAAKPMAIRVEVTAEDGTRENYTLVMSKSAAAAEGEALLQKLRREADDKAAADTVMALIDAIGPVTADSRAAIAAARAAYDALTDEQKLLVTNVSKLVDAENTPLPIDPPDPLPAPVPTGDTGIMVYLLVCVLCCMTALFAVRRRTKAE